MNFFYLLVFTVMMKTSYLCEEHHTKGLFNRYFADAYTKGVDSCF